MWLQPKYYSFYNNHRVKTHNLFVCVGVLSALLLTFTAYTYKGLPLMAYFLVTSSYFLAVPVFYVIDYVFTGNRRLRIFRYIIVVTIAGFISAYFYSPSEALQLCDITALGVGTFHSFSKIGCHHSGCCYGRAHSNGINYTNQHIYAGLPENYSSIKMLPIQFIETVMVALLVIVGIIMIYCNLTAGLVLCWYLSAYSAVRYILEYFRGDTNRHYLFGVSEAQWTAVFVTGICCTLSYLNYLPKHIFILIAFSITVFATLITVLFHFMRKEKTPILES